MMMLTRLFRATLTPKSSYMYFASQKHIDELSSSGREGDAQIGNFHKDSACHEMTNGVMEKRCSLNGEDSDPAFLKATSYKQNKAIYDLCKKLKLILKGSKGSRRRYIMDRNVAETLVKYLKRDLGDSDIIVESSPGLGLLTETILAETTNSVVVYEPNNKLRSNLKKSMLPQNSLRLQIQDHDFEKFYGYYIADQREPEKPVLQNFLQPMLRKEGSKFLPVKIVGVVYDSKFIGRLILTYIFQCCLYGEISPVLYIYLPFSIYCKITRGPNYVYNCYGLQFQYYFDMETLHVAPKESFHPINTKSKKTSDDDMYLVKISPQKEFFQKVPHRELESFHYFINIVSRIKRTDTLIIGMERWIPDCGPELIKNGLQVFAHPRELTAEQLLQAYKIFTSLPSYQESTFHYQRQQFCARFGSKDGEMLENKSADDDIELDDHEFMET